MTDAETPDDALDAVPVDTSIDPDPRVFPIELGKETYLDIDGLEVGRVRVAHEEGQVVVKVAEENWDCNREVADSIEIPLTEDREAQR